MRNAFGMTIASALCAVGVGAVFLMSRWGLLDEGLLETMGLLAVAGVCTGVIAVARERRPTTALAAAAFVLLVNLAIAAGLAWWVTEIVSNLE